MIDWPNPLPDGWGTGFNKQYDTKVGPHIGLGWYEGLDEMGLDHIIVTSHGTKFRVPMSMDENGHPTLGERPSWKPLTEHETWMLDEWFPARFRELHTKVEPHLDLKRAGEGEYIITDEYVIVPSGEATYYLEIASDEQGLPILPERPFWKLYAGDYG